MGNWHYPSAFAGAAVATISLKAWPWWTWGALLAAMVVYSLLFTRKA